MTISALRLAAASVVIVACTHTVVAQSTNDRGGSSNACCFPDGTCIETVEEECISQGGQYQGEGFFCQAVRGTAPAMCIPRGGCCMPDGTCIPDMTQDECEAQNNLWFGAGTDCSIDCLSYALGACCLPDGSCSSSEDMLFCETELGGVWQGPKTLCGESACISYLPPNDDCENAIPISSLGFPEYGSTVGATGDFIPDCETTDRGLTASGVWYSVTGTGSLLEANVCVPEFQPTRGGRSYLYVFCGGCDNLNCVAGDGGSQVWSCLDSGRSLDAVQWCSELGREYLVFVSLESVGQAEFMLTVDDLEQPCEAGSCGLPNDDCEDAITLYTYDEPIFGTSGGAQGDVGVFDCFEKNRGGPAGVWYRVIGTGNELELELCYLNPNRGGEEAAVAVLCGGCNQLNCVTSRIDYVPHCDLRDSNDRSSGVSWCSEEGREYLIFIEIIGADDVRIASHEDFLISVYDTGNNECDPEPCGVEPEDFCEDAQRVCPGVTYYGHTFDATSDYLDHGGSFDTIFFCGMYFGVYDVWYRYTPAEDGLLFVHIEGPPTEYVFGIYDDCPGLPEDLLACNIARHHGVIVFWVNAYDTYYIRAAGTYFSRGEFEMDLVGPPCADGILPEEQVDYSSLPKVTLPR